MTAVMAVWRCQTAITAVITSPSFPQIVMQFIDIYLLVSYNREA
ncbi:hypothetical protein Krac_11825 [Ktedonobacter racemifer DSM 44963]|uniref:Uncharacterized protein n=1 Tax=Ktedonobacter racemifer DSM 44963 TaxID=485913 RepID=D6TDT2_KTERA|nr:hypothetical protein Krac_11825 [Ktedonobacter racemifer DSM 44963]